MSKPTARPCTCAPTGLDAASRANLIRYYLTGTRGDQTTARRHVQASVHDGLSYDQLQHFHLMVLGAIFSARAGKDATA